LTNSKRTDSQPMQPARIRCYHFNKVFKMAFHSPQARRFQADSVIVRIDDGHEASGFGESAPRPYVTGESVASVVSLIVDRFAPILFAQPLASLNSIQAVLEHLASACRQAGVTAFNSALGAIDLALLDLLERAQRLAPNQIFPTMHRDSLRFSVSVPFLPLDVIKAHFPRFRDQMDIAVLKILVSENATETYERVKLIRRLAGADSELRLEFNGKMDLPRVRDTLARLIPFRIRAVEQPLPKDRLDDLHQLAAQFNVDFVADESLVTVGDAEQLVQNGAYRIFNIKVSKCGGLLRSQRIAQLAAQHGIPCQIGTHVGESEILGLAGRRLARSLPNFDCYGGGSEVLFSRLFELAPQNTTAIWPPVDKAPLGPEALRELVSEDRLLADACPTATRWMPFVDVG
jgi:L-alanine-DL-glutamate epimerase-like enolase superfamily enzyme